MSAVTGLAEIATPIKAVISRIRVKVIESPSSRVNMTAARIGSSVLAKAKPRLTAKALPATRFALMHAMKIAATEATRAARV